MGLQSSTEKSLPLRNSLYRSEYLRTGVCFNDVAQCTHGKRLLHHFCRGLLGQKNDSCLSADLADLSSNIQTIYSWKPDVEKNDIWLQYRGLLHSFWSVVSCADNLQKRGGFES